MENKNITEVTTEMAMEFNEEELATMAADDYCQIFGEEKAMKEFLLKMQNTMNWETCKSNGMKITALTDGPICIPMYQEKYKSDASYDEWRYVTDDMGSRFGIQIPELGEKMYLLTNAAYAGALIRAGVDCTAIGKFPYDDKELFINKGFAIQTDGAEGKVQVLNGKILTMNGRMYVPFNNSRIFNEIVRMLDERFPGYKFELGTYSHQAIEASWTMPKQAKELLDTYNETLEKSDTHVDFGDMIPSIRFYTSDIRDSSAYIEAVIKRGKNFEIKIGTPISVDHRGSENEQRFIDSLAGLYAQFYELTEGLAQLANIKIKHPVNTMLNIAFGTKIQLNKKCTLDAIEVFKAICPEGESATAADVFYTLQEALYNMRNAEKPVADSTIATVEEDLTKLIRPSFPWDEYDTEILRDASKCEI